VHFPNTDGTIPNASGKVYSEVWYAYNPDYMSGSTGANATSYSSAVKGSIGAAFTADFKKADPMHMTVTSITSGTLQIGDHLSSSDPKLTTTFSITAVPSPGPTGQYTFAGNVYTGSAGTYSTNTSVESTKLMVSGVTSALTTGPTNEGVTIASGPDGSGNYTVSTAMTVVSQVFTQGTSGSTIKVPGATLPSVGTIVAVYSLGTPGTGAFAASTTVTGTATGQFTVSPPPTSPLKNAIVCGGTCAFFNGPSSTTSTTEFTVAATAGTTQWAGGFVCLKGVDKPNIIPVTSSSSTASRWQEVVQ
ncbi:MAG TPA: hypothetical protein VK968_05750, partial [Roseimicrobium sp.]|nr:hypothetical protein [Roseimicrobium sp.]